MWNSIEQLLNHIGDQIASIKASIDLEEAEMKTLKDAGLIYAGTWYKSGKYLYLIHPSDGFGYRKREYVGAEPEKIAAALEGIERGRKYDKAKARRNRLRDELNTIQYHLMNAERVPNGDSYPGRPASIAA